MTGGTTGREVWTDGGRSARGRRFEFPIGSAERRRSWGVGGRREEAARACVVGGEEARRRGLAEGKAPGLLDSGVRGRLFMTVVMSLLAFSFSKFEYG